MAKSSIIAQYAAEDAIKHVYDITFFGEAIRSTVTKHPDAVTEWINGVNVSGNSMVVGEKSFLPVGFALEFDSTTSFGRGLIGSVQLCVGNQCLVIHIHLPNTWACAPSLDRFLGDKNNVFVGTFLETKVRMLKQQFPIRAEVECMELGPVGQEEKETILASVDFGDVDVVENDWARPCKLSDLQVQYASVDAFLNRQLADLQANRYVVS